jgi:hypothetical protein
VLLSSGTFSTATHFSHTLAVSCALSASTARDTTTQGQSCVALGWVALRCVALRCVALRCVALRCVALRCVALRCVALRCGHTLALLPLVEVIEERLDGIQHARHGIAHALQHALAPFVCSSCASCVKATDCQQSARVNVGKSARKRKWTHFR